MLLFLFGKGEWRNRNEKSVKIRNAEIGKIEERRNQEDKRQHRTVPALRLKHCSGSCGTASALPKCSIMSGCGTRIVLRGAKAPRTLRPLPLLRFAVSATGGAHLCSIQYYLRFWLSICRTSLAVSALRIMRYCPYNFYYISYFLTACPGVGEINRKFTPL